MCIGKCVLVVGVLSCVVAQSLNAMPYTRPVSRVSSAVVSEIKGALASNRPELVLQHLHDNGLSVNSQLTDKHETVLHLVAQLGKQQAAEKLLTHGARKRQGGGVARVNVRDRDGNSPLDYAQAEGHTQLAELLQTYTQVELAALQNTTKPQDLFEAAANNNRAGAELLLAEGADLHEKKHHGKTAYNQLGFKTPFHIAFEEEHYSLAAFLLKAAQGINGLDEQGWTPLMLAIVADDWDMVRELIVDGADIFAGYRRSSPIQNALAVAQMMKSEAQLVDIFVEEKGANGVVHTYGETIPFIMWASEGEYTEIVQLLHDHGAELDSEKVMLLAMQRKNWKRVLTLIEDEAKLIDVFIATKGVDRTIGEIHGDTLLTLAAQGGHTKVVELLIANNADVNIKDKVGSTALGLAAEGGHTEIAKLLIDLGADIHIQNEGGMTALGLAAWEGHTEIAKLLIDQGADFDITDKYGRTALTIAARQGHTEIAKLLIDLGADFDITDNFYGITALMLAAEGGHAEIAKLLIDQGADLDITDKYGKTALRRAVQGGHVEIVKLLIDQGADFDITDRYGKTALRRAVQGGHVKIVKLLIDQGADFDITDKYGTSALDFVFMHSHINPKIRDMLRSAQEQRYK